MRITFYFLLVLLTHYCLSASAEPIKFTPFFSAKVITEEAPVTQAYRLALGAYVKKDNRWQPSDSQRVTGSLSRQTHELPAGFDEQEVFEFYRDQIPSTAETLFTCERRKCGESNSWANDHFRIKQLYGLNQYQFYGVYRIEPKQTITLYTVRRGNRRVYVQIDIIEAN